MGNVLEACSLSWLTRWIEFIYFFVNIAEIGDSFIYTPEKERVERTIPPKEEGLIYKDVNLFRLRSERKKWEKMQKKIYPKHEIVKMIKFLGF